MGTPVAQGAGAAVSLGIGGAGGGARLDVDEALFSPGTCLFVPKGSGLVWPFNNSSNDPVVRSCFPSFTDSNTATLPCPLAIPTGSTVTVILRCFWGFRGFGGGAPDGGLGVYSGGVL